MNVFDSVSRVRACFGTDNQKEPNVNRVKRISGRTGLVLAGLLVGLSLCEIMIRIGVCLSSGLHATVNFGEVNQFSEHKNFESYLKTQGVHIRPHQEWRGYWTNSLGFYDREFEIHKPDNLLRILSLGDSFCYGMVPYTENVQTLLEERLNFWSETVDIEVLNCGVAATGVEDYQKLYHYAESRFNPDVVLLQFILEMMDLILFSNMKRQLGRQAVSGRTYGF